MDEKPKRTPTKRLRVKRKENFDQGAPKTYDDNLIMEQMLDWAKKEDSINICGFCVKYGYTPQLIWRLEQSNASFDIAYNLVKMQLSERRERLTNENKLNYGSYNRYQKMLDPFLSSHEDKEKDQDAERKKGIVQAEGQNLADLAKLIAEGKLSQE
jgi:hypothetical protein